MRRRDFILALTASMLPTRWPAQAQTQRRPRLLIADTDPFTGLPLLKSRYLAGRRPSEDMEGWALSWLLTGNDAFAERALAEMRAKRIAGGAGGFDELDAPVLRVSQEDVPMPYNEHLEKAVLPNADKLIAAVKKVCYA